MAGYAVTARIQSVRPHRTGAAPRAIRAAQRPSREAEALDAARTAGPQTVPIGIDAWERWVRVRDRWTQLVFYLFDPDSWR